MAQLDRASAFEADGWGFESLRALQLQMKGGSIMLYDVETYSPHMEINVSKGLTLDEAKLELIKRRFGDPHREHGIRERELRRYVIIISHPPGTHAWLTDKFPPGYIIGMIGVESIIPCQRNFIIGQQRNSGDTDP